MIGLREFRFWTALLVIVLAAFAISRALPVLRFGLAEATAVEISVVAASTPFSDVPTVAVQARRDILSAMDDDDAAARAAALSALLSRAPIAGGGWLDLASARMAAGEPSQRVAGALALSSLTAPNESDVMAGRAGFGLPLWDALPPDVRRTLVGDLVGGWGSVSEDSRAALQAVFALAAPKTRADLRAQLLLAGKPGTAIADRLKLAPPPAFQLAPDVSPLR